MTDILDTGCTCHLGNPPCAFCTNTFECEQCGTRVATDDQETEGWHVLICDECCNKAERLQSSDDIMKAIRRASGDTR